MAVSCWGRIRDNTIDLIRKIEPTVDSRVRWQHIGPDKDLAMVGASDREYTTRELEVSGSEDGIAGAGQRQQRWTLSLRIAYRPTTDVEDRIGGDHVDLVSALQPSSTYISGTWGSLNVRRVLDFDREEDEETGLVLVNQQVEHILRYPVSI